jgi:small subunit ribosomal protein S5
MAKGAEGGRREKDNREASESGLKDKVLFVNRCSKTVKGGKKMSFSALILVGDEKGRVGYGFAKANELTDAIRKGGEAAKKNMITVCIENGTIPHDVVEKWDGVTLVMRPAPEGTGVIAGSKVRAVLSFAGIVNVMAKMYGSSNPINQVRAVFRALASLQPREAILAARGIEHETK